uniref:DDE-1 domain-containing protein n=1 Tax=Bionectria ochroleuca TaxID=29856 RepID=A0A8H7K8Z9_BIOOC
MSSDSELDNDNIISRWIDPITKKPVFSRFTPDNLEQRTVAAAELFRARYYKTITAASKGFGVPYHRLRSRIQGHSSINSNGGLNTLLDEAQTKAVVIWAHRQILTGFHVRGRRLRQHCNRFMKKHRTIFHLRKALSRDAKRKGVQKRAILTSWFDCFKSYLQRNRVKERNMWNFDETGFMIGYLEKGIFVWTFLDINQPVLTDSFDKVMITSVDCISAAGAVIPPFLIAPGIQIPVKWIKHFNEYTRPDDPDEIRVLLMDNQECHLTDEFIEYCYLNNTLFPLPPNSTHYLQPCDVGVFGPYKHWHQEVLYREIADGAYNFNKTDFFFHLQEIRDRTFKKSTILSAWQRSGLFPYNPSVVLDTLQDPLSSLTPNMNESSLPGYIEVGDKVRDEDENSSSNEGSSSSEGLNLEELQPSAQQPASVTTPQRTPHCEWKEVLTPTLNIPMIERYHRYIQLRIELSIGSGLPLTPSVLRTYDKVRKVGRALELNGITASNELRRHKEKILIRQKLHDERRVVARFGPISAGDARSRIATDDYNRRAAQEDEAQRIERKAIRNEEAFLRRWLHIVRGFIRKDITEIDHKELKEMTLSLNRGFASKINAPFLIQQSQ